MEGRKEGRKRDMHSKSRKKDSLIVIDRDEAKVSLLEMGD